MPNFLQLLKLSNGTSSTAARGAYKAEFDLDDQVQTITSSQTPHITHGVGQGEVVGSHFDIFASLEAVVSLTADSCLRETALFAGQLLESASIVYGDLICSILHQISQVIIFCCQKSEEARELSLEIPFNLQRLTKCVLADLRELHEMNCSSIDPPDDNDFQAIFRKAKVEEISFRVQNMGQMLRIPTFYSERERSSSPSIGKDLNRELQNLTLDGSTKHLDDQEILLDDPERRHLRHASLYPHQEDLPDRSLSFWQPTTDVDVLVEEQMPTEWYTALVLPTAVSEYERPSMAVHGSLIGDAGRFSLPPPPTPSVQSFNTPSLYFDAPPMSYFDAKFVSHT